MNQLHLRIQRQKQRQHIRKSKSAENTASHRSQIPELHPDNTPHTLPCRTVGISIQPLILLHLPQEFEEADISWEELLEIADDYERRRPTLEKIRKEFVAEFLQDKEKEIGLQSYHSRLKDTEHLVEKLVRKRLENYAKYRKMDATNYMRYVTDLIGIRGLLLYREDWVNFHKYIIHWFKNDPEKYIRDYGRDYDQNASGYMAEPP